MEYTPVRNHDHLNWDAVRQCEAVHRLSRLTPSNRGDFESPESMLSRVDSVADGMKTVIERVCRLKFD